VAVDEIKKIAAIEARISFMNKSPVTVSQVLGYLGSPSLGIISRLAVVVS